MFAGMCVAYGNDEGLMKGGRGVVAVVDETLLEGLMVSGGVGRVV